MREKDVEIARGRDQIEALRLDHGMTYIAYLCTKLFDHLFLENLGERYDETVAELRIVAAAKAEKDQQLAKAKEQENLLQIPIADVTMTEIKLGGGSFAGKNKKNKTTISS